MRKKDLRYDNSYSLYQSGFSLEMVAQELGVTRQCVYKAYKKRGFVLRNATPQPDQFFNGKKFTKRPSGYFALTVDERMLMHRYVWSFYNGEIPNGWDVHHIDEDISNNDILNLRCLSKSDHSKLHGFRNNQHTINHKCK